MTEFIIQDSVSGNCVSRFNLNISEKQVMSAFNKTSDIELIDVLNKFQNMSFNVDVLLQVVAFIGYLKILNDSNKNYSMSVLFYNEG